MAGLNVERLILAATALGIAQRAFDDVARLRQGAQAVRAPDRLLPGAEAPDRRPRDRARVRPACSIYDVARKVDADPTAMFPTEASMAKLKATEVAKHVSLEGMQMMGGYGYALRVRHGAHVRATLVDVDLRRHERDPARDRLEDVRAVDAAAPVRRAGRNRSHMTVSARSRCRHPVGRSYLRPVAR